MLSLNDLRVSGLVTFPSPLLGRLLEYLPAVLEREVLSRLTAVSRAKFARVDRACRVGPSLTARSSPPQPNSTQFEV